MRKERKASYQGQISDLSDKLPEGVEEVILIHIIERGFDDQDYFCLIDKELEDKFIIRLKLNRNSGFKKWEDIKGKEVNQKIKEASFTHHSNLVLEHFSWAKKIYRQVNLRLEWDDFYQVVRVTLRDSNGRKIFKEPMLLVSNLEVHSEAVACHIFKLYLKRSKIEVGLLGSKPKSPSD